METNDMTVCPACGTANDPSWGFCPGCGRPLTVKTETRRPDMRKLRSIIAVVLCLVACFCLYRGVAVITDQSYKFRMEHYADCMSGWSEVSELADSYPYGFFKDAYEDIADGYMEMAEDDMEKIWEFRTKAILFGASGALLLIGALVVLPKKRASGRALTECPNCKGPVTGPMRICPQCGAELPAEAPASAAKVFRYLVPVLAVVAVFAAAAVTVSAFREADRENTSTHKARGRAESYSAPRTGTEGALAKAESYLRSSAFSYSGLIDQLEYSGFSTYEATYAADNCGADWNEQALRKARSYLDSSAFSYTGLINQLEYSGFTPEQAKYGADRCGANWKEEAAEKAKSYLRTFPDWTRSKLKSQLEYCGFTSSEATYGVDHCGKNW